MACLTNSFLSLVVLWTCINFAQVYSSKLSVPRVLLPIFKEYTPNFTIEVTDGDGCYNWKSAPSGVLIITPLDQDPFLKCSTKVNLHAQGFLSFKTTAVILAEEVGSDVVLRCDVIFDHINSLDLKSKSRDLFISEAPELFEIRALDAQGNEFSTLDGITFDWEVINLGKKKDSEVIRYMPFSAFNYDAPLHIVRLEEQDKKGNMVLVESVKTGASMVTVRLLHEEYFHIKPLQVQITVAANIILEPHEAYIMAGDYLEYRIYMITDGKVAQIELPSMQYYLDSKHYKVAKVAKNKGQVFGMSVGTATVELHDKMAVSDAETLLKLPSAVVHIVVPSYMKLNVMPYRNWAVIIGEKHEIVAEVFTVSEHKLTLGLGVKVEMASSNQFQVEARSQNGTWMSGWCAKKGVAVIDATLQNVENPIYGNFRLDKPLKARGELLIFPKITISPSEIILPWDPMVKPKYDILLTAKGGDGKFLWSSSDNSAATVSQTGHVRTLGAGSFEISAAMLRNHYNRHTAKFSIFMPSRIEIVDNVLEAEIGYPVYVHIALYAERFGEKGELPVFIPFTYCQDLPFHLKLSNDKFRQNRTDVLDPVGISCGNIALVAFAHGSSKVTVSYLIDGKLLEDTSTISAYKAIRLEHPEADVVLGVGSSGYLVFTGGPKPAITKPSEHYRVVSTTDPNIASAIEETDPHTMMLEDFTVVQVLCRKLGETDLLLKISNSPILSTTKSTAGSARVKIICGKPRSISLQPEIKIVDVQTACPMDVTASKVVVPGYDDVELDVTVLDHAGRKFLNISSFLYDWKLDQNGQALGTSVFPRPHLFGSVHIPHRNYQTIRPLIETGSIKIEVTITSYNMSILEPQGIIPEWPEFLTSDDKVAGSLPPIQTSIELVLVEDTVIVPNDVNLYNNPSHKQTLKIINGSGYYKILLNSDTMAQVTYHESTREIEVVPVQSGELIIQVVDLCLLTNPASALVNIISVGIIRVETSDKVELGKCIHTTVRLYDENDNLMIIDNVDVVALKHEISTDIMTIQKMPPFDEGESWPPGEAHYILTGTEVGETRLVFSVNNGFTEIQSAPVEVQVFAPLKLYPRNGSLIVGATLQVTTKGGPLPNLQLEYTVTPGEFAEINSKGILVGTAVGDIEIMAKSIGIHPTTGRKVIYSEDTITMRILILPAIKLAAPLTRFKVGATVPLWVNGIPDHLTPMILGTMEDPSIQYVWFVEDTQIAVLNGIFDSVGINYLKNDQITMKLTGVAAGRTRVSLNMTVPGVSTDLDSTAFVVFAVHLDIEVFEELRLVNPPNFNSRFLLMAPHSTLRLITNFGETRKIVFKLEGETTVSQDIAVAGEGFRLLNDVISLSKDGVVKSFGVFGESTITVIAKDEHGLKQVIHFIIVVREIYYMMAGIEASWRAPTASNLKVIPKGAEFELKITFYDNIGNQFDAGPDVISIRTSRCDLTKIKPGSTNSTLLVATKNPGHTVLKVWAEGVQQTADYLKLHVGNVVKPTLTHVTRGDIICLWTPIMPSKPVSGRWLTSDKNLLYLLEENNNIGVVVGNREGVAIVTHTLLPSAPLHLDVLPIQDIILNGMSESESVITNYHDDKIFRTSVVLHNEHSRDVKFSNMIHGWNCHKDVKKYVTNFPFTCFLSFSNQTRNIKASAIFHVQSVFLIDSGHYACEIKSTHKNASEVSTLETKIFVWALSIDNPDIVSQKFEIPFFPGIYTAQEIILPSNGVGEMVITGLPFILSEVVVKAADASIVYVGNPIIEEYKSTYRVQLLDYHWRLAGISEAVGVYIFSPQTNQTMEVLLKVGDGLFTPSGACFSYQSPLLRFFNTYRQALAIIVSMAVIFLSSFYVYSRYLQPVVNVNVSSPMAPSSARPRPGNTSFSSSCLRPSVCSCARCAPGSSEPIYGDMSSFYNTSPELRRNRRFL